MKAHLTEHDLLKALDGQGFEVDETKDGYKVLPPDGGKPVFFHTSTLDKSPRAYNNVLSMLRRRGFVEPEDMKLARLNEGKQRRREADEAERAAGPYVCVDCGAEKPFKRNLARHQQTFRHGEHRDRPIVADTPKKVKVKREPTEVKARHIMHKMKSQVAALNASFDELFELVEPMEKQNHEMRAKLQRIERAFGNVIEQL